MRPAYYALHGLLELSYRKRGENGNFKVLGVVGTPLGAVIGGKPSRGHSGSIQMLIPRPPKVSQNDYYSFPTKDERKMVILRFWGW